MRYTNPACVKDVCITQRPKMPTVTGYGSKVPTRYMVLYRTITGRAIWRRVYVTQWANAGTAWIAVNGEQLALDTWTDHRLIEKDYERIAHTFPRGKREEGHATRQA